MANNNVSDNSVNKLSAQSTTPLQPQPQETQQSQQYLHPTANWNGSSQLHPELFLERQIYELRKRHEFQQQVLLQNYEVQHQQLVEQHELEIKQFLREYWEHQECTQKIHNEPNKSPSERGSNISSEVKQRLQVYLMKKRETAAFSKSGVSGMDNMRDDLHSLYYPNEYPLRKTASEPNLLKVRLKQRVMERRCNPFVNKRSDKLGSILPSTASLSSASSSPSSTVTTAFKRKLFINNNASLSSSFSSADSPISNFSSECTLVQSKINNENQLNGCNNESQELFSCPSMPNIACHGHHFLGKDKNDVFEARIRAALAARLINPLNNDPLLSGFSSHFNQFLATENQSNENNDIINIEDTVKEFQALSKPKEFKTYGHNNSKRNHVRQIGRTQSSPLPLGHPLLNNSDHKNIFGLFPNVLSHVTSNLGKTAEETAAELHSYSNETIENSDDRPKSVLKSISRTTSSPTVQSKSSYGFKHISVNNNISIDYHVITTGLAFDSQMLKHTCICNDNSNHPEHPGRIQSILTRLHETGLINSCDRMRPRKATIQELQVCHTEFHALLYGTSPANRIKLDVQKQHIFTTANFVRLPCGGVGVDADTVWNDLFTGTAARVAAGCVIDLAYKVVRGDIRNGFAFVRPPGHHAESSQAMGFCYFNSIAIAAKLIQKEFSVKKILIFDWDIHHGNGTQNIFYNDNNVLVISIHRHDDGNFFPGTGAIEECGANNGLGFNINIAWSGGLNPPLGDAEYLSAFQNIVLPIVKNFDPQVIFVSAGFDAADDHSPALGGYKVSSACFGYMTYQLMKFASGKVILALEGGYSLTAICEASEECVRVLLGDKPSSISTFELERKPCENAIYTLQNVVNTQINYWPCIKTTASSIYRSFNQDSDSKCEN